LAAEPAIDIPRLLWWRLVGELTARSQGERESGAFLLRRSVANERRVRAFVCYDDLDPHCLVGSIEFHAEGYSALWQLCRERNLEVAADIHTHPGAGVGQSPIDARNPMLAVPGHVALIAPRFGRTSKLFLSGIGIHVFHGRGRWVSYSHRSRGAPVRLVW
jgi:proteasome lid subunit RPN8/RPN11